MLTSIRILLIAGVFCLLLIVPQAQNDRLIVAIVNDNDLNAVVSNPGIGDSISDLLNTVDSFEVEQIVIDLRSSVVDAVDLVIMVRPRGLLTPTQTAHLWEYLQKGGNVLFAFDPNNYNNVQTEGELSGINQLLDDAYGIQLQDNLLVEPWFDVIPLFDITRSWSTILIDKLLSHPITEPLITYDLPIRFWVARSLQIEAVNGYARTNTLLYTENLHGEVSAFNLDDTSEGQFALNVGEDYQGQLPIASISESLENGSRVAVIGDSEIFQNGFGQLSNDGVPIHVGDYLFAQRLLQWLLEIPEELWLPLPIDFTWVLVDGQVDDWASFETVIYADEETDEVLPAIDIQQIHMFHNDAYLYIYITTAERITSDVSLALDYKVVTASSSLTIKTNGATLTEEDSTETLISDIAYSIDDVVELRIPLRLVTDFPIITQICLLDTFSSNSDCYNGELSSVQVAEVDPTPVTFSTMPMAYVITTASLFSDPDGDLITEMPTRTQLAVTGRNEFGDWVKVISARYEGWVRASELAINARRNTLRITEN